MLAVETANSFQKTIENIKNKIDKLEKEIECYGYEIGWYHNLKNTKYLAKKNQIESAAKSELAEGDEYNEYIGRLIALTRLITIVRKVEGEEDG